MSYRGSTGEAVSSPEMGRFLAIVTLSGNQGSLFFQKVGYVLKAQLLQVLPLLQRGSPVPAVILIILVLGLLDKLCRLQPLCGPRVGGSFNQLIRALEGLNSSSLLNEHAS